MLHLTYHNAGGSGGAAIDYSDLGDITSPVRWDELQHRIISVWELFVEIIPADKFTAAHQHLVSLSQALLTAVNNPDNEFGSITLPESQLTKLKSDVGLLHDCLKTINMDMAAQTAERLIDVLDNICAVNGNAILDKSQIVRLDHHFRELGGRIPDQFKTRVVFVIPYQAKILYESDALLFG
jgi:hypothetical protein